MEANTEPEETPQQETDAELESPETTTKPEPDKNKLPISKILTAFIAVILIAGVSWFLWQNNQAGVPASESQNQAEQKQPTEWDGYRVIYTIEDEPYENEDGETPSVTMWYQDAGFSPRQVGDRFPQSAEDASFISNSVASSDGKFVFIAYNDRLDRITIETAEIKTLWRPDNGFKIDSVGIDKEEQLFVSSSVDYINEQNRHVYVDQINPETGESNRVLDSTDQTASFGLRLINANQEGGWVVSFMVPKDGFYYGTINVKEGKIERSESSGVNRIADYEPILATATSTIETSCSLTLEEASSYELSNIFTNERLGNFGVSNKILEFTDFSRDGTYALVEARNPVTNEADCGEFWEDRSNVQYFSVSIKDGKSKEVKSRDEAFALWSNLSNEPAVYVQAGVEECVLKLLDGVELSGDKGGTCLPRFSDFTIIDVIKLQ